MPSNSTSIYCSNTRQPYTLSVSWSESSSSITSNTSVISASGSLGGANVSFASSYNNFYLKLYWHDNRTNSDTHIATSGAFSSCGMGYGSRHVSGTITVKHKDDGSLSGYVRVRFESGNSSGGWAPGTSDLSTSYSALTTIARASDFNIIQGEGLLGSMVTVDIKPKASNFGHKVEYSFEDSSWTSASAVSAEEGISASFYPPLTLASQIPNNTTGVLSIRVTTLSGSTTIGSPVVKTVNLSIPESVVPTMDQPSHLIVSESVPKNWNVYVKGHSSSTISINNARGIYGSTIKSYSISGPGLSSSLASDTTNILRTAGKNEYTCAITDSRGRIAVKTVSINVEDYSLPSIAVDAKRCDSTGNIVANGTYLKVIVDWNISSVAGKNSVFERFVECNGVKNTTFGDNDEFILAANLSIGSTYILKAYIKDAMGLTDGKTISISTAERILNVKANKKGLAIGKFSEKDNTFEVDWKSEFNKGIKVIGESSFTDKTNLTDTFIAGPLVVGMRGLENKMYTPLIMHDDLVMSGEQQTLNFKTKNGVWYLSSLDDELYFKYMTDADIEAKNNKVTALVKIGTDSTITAKPTFTYSTSEQWTGDYWLDGKKIYVKTVHFGNITLKDNVRIEHGIKNVDRIIKHEGWMHQLNGFSSEFTFMFPLVYRGGDMTYGVNQSYIDFVGTDTWTGNTYRQFYITIYYTKYE